MSFGLCSFLFCVLLRVSAALPTDGRQRTGSLLSETTCVKSADDFDVDGTLSLLQTGYSMMSGSSLSMGLKMRRSHQVVRHGSKTRVIHKQAYFGSVFVGTPRQEFTVVFDTGSGNLLIPGQGCKDDACTKHVRFNQEKSSTVKEMSCKSKTSKQHHDELSITFGTGHIAGHCLEDNICIGHMCARGTFVASTTESDNPFADFKFDGVMGLARTSMAHAPEFALMNRMVSSNLLAKPLFSVFLSDSDDETSDISFGSVPKEHMASELFWVPVSERSGYWEVKIDDISFDNKRQHICEDCHVAVDTGTSELAGPSDTIAQLRDSLQVMTDCSNFEKLPKLGFVMGSKVLNLQPTDYVNKNSMGTECDLSLMSLDVPPPKGPLFVFGIPFLQKFFTVYDHANSQVGFAIAKHKGGQATLLDTVEQEVTASVLTQSPLPSQRSEASIKVY